MPNFSIAAAQIPSIRGEVSTNLVAHAAAIAAGAARQVSIMVFPELSLTGYEPDLAATLAFSTDDNRLASLRALARQYRMTLVVGAPAQNGPDKPAIGGFVFTPDGGALTYLKMHLGASEVAYFSQGEAPLTLHIDGHRIGLAICADSSSESHPRTYAECGATIYAAGVFLTDEWYVNDVPRLQKYAKEFGLMTLMANQGASKGSYESVGRSAVWAPGGQLLVQADGSDTVLVTAALTRSGWQGEIVRI